MWQAFVDLIASGLLYINDILLNLGVVYSFGFAIILFTLIIKALTYPLNRKQIQSTKATQELQPKLKALQKKYAKDKEQLSKAQMELYKEHGVNPLGGCLPTLVQMPIWFALYRALLDLSSEGLLTEGFFWIPSLAGPVSTRGGGLDWINPNSETFLGWAQVAAYLVLPILLVVSQLVMQRMMTPKSDDPQQKTMSQVMTFMPFMFGYFSLVVPSGLSLYWFTNNLLSLGQQWWMHRGMGKEDQADKSKQTKDTTDNDQLTIEGSVVPTSEEAPEADVQVQANGQPKSQSSKSKSTRSSSRRKRKRKKQR